MPCPSNPCCTQYNPYSPCDAPCPLENSPIIFKAVAISAQTGAPTDLQGQTYPVLFPFFVLPSEFYDTATSSFVAPFTGVYNFQATITWNTGLNNTILTLFLQKNGVNTKFVASTMAPIPGAYVTTVQGNLNLSQGDAVGVAYQSSQSVSILGSNPYPTPITYFQGQRVC